MKPLAALLALLLLALFVGPVAANHGRPYSRNVTEARQWLREHTTDRGFRCAHVLWENESGWYPRATTPGNASSRRAAYGIPQAYPGRRMAVMGQGWRHRAILQVRWGLRYVRYRYGTFCRALRFQSRWGYY